MKQDRVKITDLNAIIENEVSMKNWLMKNVITFVMLLKGFPNWKAFVLRAVKSVSCLNEILTSIPIVRFNGYIRSSS
jgi:hypothetical protein